MYIHLEIPDEWNGDKKKLKTTWKKIIKAGLESLAGKSSPDEGIPPAVETHLKQALENMREVVSILKPFMKK